MNFKPHKACDADLDRVRYPVIVMPKIDGVRACHITGELTSRNLKPFRNERLEQQFNKPEFAGLDGEMAVGSAVSQSLCRDTTSFCSSFGHKTEDIPLPVWYLFDWLLFNGEPYKNRLAKLNEFITQLVINDPSSNLVVVPYNMAKSPEEVMQWHDMYISQGYEGTILRDPNGMHKNGRCTKNEANFLRIKNIADEEAVIIDVIEAMENLNPQEENELGLQKRSSHKENKVPKGMIGSLIVKIPDGREITIGAGHMTHDERVYYFHRQHMLIGNICTYKYMPHGEKDMRRHPRFKHLRTGDI